jgi:aconitate hydratase
LSATAAPPASATPARCPSRFQTPSTEGDLVACLGAVRQPQLRRPREPHVKANYLASPPLVVAYAIAGTCSKTSPGAARQDKDGNPVYLKDIWPTRLKSPTGEQAVTREMFQERYADVFAGDELAGIGLRRLTYTGRGGLHLCPEPALLRGHEQGAGHHRTMSTRPAVLAVLADSITTDHISPAGSIKADSPAGTYLTERQVRHASSTPTARAAATTR